MAFLSKSEFCELYLIKSKDLSNYIKRGNVVVDSDGLINSDEDKNRQFIVRRRAKMDNALADPAIKSDSPRAAARMREVMDGDSDSPSDGSGIMSLTQSDQHYKHYLAVKTERSAESERLKIAKMRGEVIPSELIPPVFLQHNQSFITAFKQAAEEMLTDYGKIKRFSIEEIAAMRAKLYSTINTYGKRAINDSLKAVAVIVQDFSIKRGVGERQ